ALRDKGYDDARVQVDCAGGEHRLRVLPREGRVALVDLRVTEPAFLLEPEGEAPEVLSALEIRWLALQNPGARFTRERPRLPGQRHPGLGLGRAMIARVLSWAAAWGKDALLSLPQYFHNAVFYSPPSLFVSPRLQGRFLALRRDLAALHVAAASAAVARGDVVEEPGGEPFRWEPGEMAVALTPRLERHLGGEAYARDVASARDTSRFRLKRR
ncbi:MAG TPA: hypothetical protein VIC87_12415, partial [Vicinamibacteria bacterium]